MNTLSKHNVPGFRYYPRLGIFKNYKASATFDPDSFMAHSYRWWRFVEKVDGLVVFNGYRYSSMTSKHQSMMRSVLSSMGIKVDVEIECRKGLSDLDVAIDDYKLRITELQAAMAVKGSRKQTNLDRALEIEAIEKKIELVEALKTARAGKSSKLHSIVDSDREELEGQLVIARELLKLTSTVESGYLEADCWELQHFVESNDNPGAV